MTYRELDERCYNAAKENEIEQLKQAIAEGADLNLKNPTNGYSPLSMAAFRNSVDAVRCLIESGAVVDNGSLFSACNFGHADVVSILLEAGADPNHTNSKTGETPLHIATCRGDREGTTECVRFLLAAGADPMARAQNRVGTPTWGGAYVVGETPLHLAAACGDYEMMEMLVEAGADPDAKDSDGHNPRFYFARYSRSKERGKIKDLLPYKDLEERHLT